MSEEAKAAQEIAKAAGKIIDATSDLGKFVGKYVGGPVEAAMGILHDKLAYVRWERRQRLIQRAEAFAAEGGATARIKPVPLSIAVPLLSSAVLEEDDYLQDEWAKLLVNASDEKHNNAEYKAFISILNPMSSLDAKILRAIVEAPKEFKSGLGNVVTKNLPDSYSPLENKLTGEGDGLSTTAKVSLHNLLRLGVIAKGGISIGSPEFKIASATPLGKAFVRACTIKAVP